METGSGEPKRMEKKKSREAAAKGLEPQIASRCVPLESEQLRVWESGSVVRSLWGNRMEARFPFQMVD